MTIVIDTDVIVTDALRRGVVLTPGHALNGPGVPGNVLTVASAELLSCGYLVDRSLLAEMAPGTVAETIRAASDLTGSNRHWAPLFSDFPDISGDYSHARALAGAASTFLASGRVPDVQTPRITLGEVLASARRVRALTRRDFLDQRLTEILSTPAGISSDDVVALNGIVTELAPVDPDGLIDRLTDVVHGHTLAHYARALTRAGLDVLDPLVDNATTADDLLRAFLAVHGEPSHPDHVDAHTRALVTLANSAAYAVRIGYVPRAARRSLVAHLGRLTAGHGADTLVTRRGLWRRVIQACHPYELSDAPDTIRALDVITADDPHRTLDSLVEQALADGDLDTVVDLLAENRPGQLLRRLVSLARSSTPDELDHLVSAVAATSHRARLTTSLSAYDGILASAVARPRLVRTIGGGTHLGSEDAEALAPETVTALTDALRAGITARLATAPAPTGPVPCGSDDPLSLIRRDASSGTTELVRGRRYTPQGTGGILRLLCHWYDTDTRTVDLDLGAVVADADLNALEVVTWDSYGNSDSICYSGDQTSAPRPDGAAEFIDVYLDALREQFPTARYVVASVYNYSGTPLNAVDHVVGAALVDNADTALFEPTQVVTSARATTGGTALIPLIFDLDDGTMMWLDTDPGYCVSGASVAGDERLPRLLRAEVARPRLTEGELATWYAAAHDADTDPDTPCDQALIDSLIGT